MALAGPSKLAKNPSAGGIDLDSAEASELAAHERVVVFEELAPGAVTERSSLLARTDDVGEEHRCEDTVGLDPGPALAHVGEEPLELCEEPVLVAEARHEVCARQLDET